MEKFIKGDIVVVPFPFSDLTNSKKRPALVLAKLDGDDVILCQITGRQLSDRFTAFNIAARYDDYKQSFYRSCTEKFAKEYMKKGKELILWLKSRFA